MGRQAGCRTGDGGRSSEFRCGWLEWLPLERMLPVEFSGVPDWEAMPTTVEPAGSEGPIRCGVYSRQSGEGDNRHFARFARNVVYWATENSAIGRRRLAAAAGKRFYHPGETVAISAQAFDETAGARARAAFD